MLKTQKHEDDKENGDKAPPKGFEKFFKNRKQRTESKTDEGKASQEGG